MKVMETTQDLEDIAPHSFLADVALHPFVLELSLQAAAPRQGRACQAFRVVQHHEGEGRVGGHFIPCVLKNGRWLPRNRAT